MSDTVRPVSSHLCRVALIAFCAWVAGCADSHRKDIDLLQLFWTDPDDLRALTRIPAGIGLADNPVLVLSLTEAPDSAPRLLRLTLEPVAQAALPDSYRLKPRDHKRFRAMQERVVASLGSRAMVNVGLEVAYCAIAGETTAKGRPVAELMDSGSGIRLMVRPSDETARSLQERLPAC